MVPDTAAHQHLASLFLITMVTIVIKKLSDGENFQPTPDSPALQIIQELICILCCLPSTVSFFMLKKEGDFIVR